MGSNRLALLASAIAIAILACGPKPQASDDVGDDDGDDSQEIDANGTTTPIDARPGIDSSIAYPDAEPYDDGGSCSNWQCANPEPSGCNPPTTEVCGDGSDNDCDGEVDELCGCQPGSVQACFRGPPGHRGIGACVDGSQTCEGSGEFATWGPCEGGIAPNSEACDTQDNDCNGCVDDNPACCVVDLACPGPGSMPDGLPYQPYVINGATFYSGTVTTWAWDVTGGPCDQLFVSQGHNPSFTLAGQTTSQLTINPTLSGDYTVHVVMTLPDGSTRECTFIIHIGGPGLRVELCWDTTGSTDIDLHTHKSGTTTPWFDNAAGTINPDDCYYMNCYNGATFYTANWGYANTPQAQCPPGWPAAGCTNPRLDLDNIGTIGKPENINVDVPVNNTPYRVMVHYYGGSDITTHPLVNIYCGGHLKATYGQAPDLVPNFNHGDGYDLGLMWRVVDVTPQVTGTTTTDCGLDPLHPPGMTSGFYVTNNNDAY
jgi:hypothetical protein